MNIYNKKANKIYDELTFSRELLGLGLTVMRKANFTKKGLYFQAFSSLSLGLERFMKICLILDFHSKNKTFPNMKYIKNFSHNLKKLLLSLNTIIPLSNRLDDIHLKIIDELSYFSDGSGTRYSNINFVLNEDDQNPISSWYNNIELFILNNVLSDKQRERLFDKAEQISMLASSLPIIAIGYTSHDDTMIDKIEKLYSNLTIDNYISGHRVLLIIQIIEYIFACLEKINSKLDSEYYLDDIGRVFATILYGSDSEKRKRKNFIRIN